MIDPHVHLRDWNQRQKEDIAHGFYAAAKVGINVLFEMPNTDPALTSYTLIQQRITDALGALGRLDVSDTIIAGNTSVPEGFAKVKTTDGSFLGYGLYGGLTENRAQLTELLQAYQDFKPYVIGFKLFAGHSTGNMGIISYDIQRQIYCRLSDAGYKGLLAVHCEKETLLHPELWNPDRPSSHTEARPAEAETASVLDQLTAAVEAGFSGILHICHVSCPETIELIESFRKDNKTELSVTVGVTPHHALLSSPSAYRAGMLAKMNPPLRNPERQKGLYQMLLDGRVDWIESDHAPHTNKEKKAGASGIPGFSGYGRLILKLMEDNAPLDLLKSLTGGRFCTVTGLAREALTSIPSQEQLAAGWRQAAAMYPGDVWKYTG
jgi:dihydroorotase